MRRLFQKWKKKKKKKERLPNTYMWLAYTTSLPCFSFSFLFTHQKPLPLILCLSLFPLSLFFFFKKNIYLSSPLFLIHHGRQPSLCHTPPSWPSLSSPHPWFSLLVSRLCFLLYHCFAPSCFAIFLPTSFYFSLQCGSSFLATRTLDLAL